MKRSALISARKKHLMTQDMVAQSVQVARSYYSHIESGKRNPRLQIALKIAEVLETSLQELFETDLFFGDKCYLVDEGGSTWTGKQFAISDND